MSICAGTKFGFRGIRGTGIAPQGAIPVRGIGKKQGVRDRTRHTFPGDGGGSPEPSEAREILVPEQKNFAALQRFHHEMPGLVINSDPKPPEKVETDEGFDPPRFFKMRDIDFQIGDGMGTDFNLGKNNLAVLLGLKAGFY